MSPTVAATRRQARVPSGGDGPPSLLPRHREVGLTDQQAVDLYRAMVVARRISEACLRLAFQGTLDVAIPADGHEAAQVASIRALRPTDFAYLFYRSIPAAYARGMTAREIMLDSFGRAAGPSSGGKNLPGHWAHRGLNLMSISGSVGTQIPNAVGTALASKVRGEDAVTIVYFGDGGASKSDFHEGLNFAAVHHVPVVLFCENNGIAISVPFEKQSPVGSIAERAAAYGVLGTTVDGGDPLAVYATTCAAVERARRGQGPTLIEAKVSRIGQHTSQVGDLRTRAEIREATAHDPLPAYAAYLRGQGLLDKARQAALEARATSEIAQAIEEARDAPLPEPSAATRDVYGPTT
ncbi:MAG: thiamine pyrophosphate-dependent dehydrogenase E1 component subunit alpha [Chloroflexi bacterium]|nr:thiamine pyrophosphate-dependent dehydrogenase E1 component subunit alpha [Chloroflexota bacterium]